jgi:hypothetical protein
MDDRDIVERLRAVPNIMSEALLCQHAADEIERLRERCNDLRANWSHAWPDWSVAPGHCEHAEDHPVLDRVRVCGWKTGLCSGPCPSCPNK